MPTATNLSELEQYIAKNPKLRPRTKHLYLLGVQSFLDFAGVSPDSWTDEAIEAWRSNLLSSGMKPQTVNVHLHAVKYVAKKYAERNGVDDFAEGTSALKVDPPKKRKPLKPEQCVALLKACEGNRPIDIRDRAICLLGLRTGLRRSALCALDMDSLKGHKLTIELKRERPHDIILDDETFEAISVWVTYLRAQEITEGPLFRALSKPRKDGSVLFRDRMSQDGIFRAVEARALSAGIQNVYPHVFYHTFICSSLAKGVTPQTIKHMLGYSSTKF